MIHPELHLDDGHQNTPVVSITDLDKQLDAIVRTTTGHTSRTITLATASSLLRLTITRTGITLSLDDEPRTGTTPTPAVPLAHVEARNLIRCYARSGHLPEIHGENR